LHLLDRLEEAVRSGWRMPGTSRCMVDENEIHEIIDSIRDNVPAQLREAQAVLNERDSTLSEAKAEAERTIATAQAHALELAQEQGLYKTAEREARRIIEEANQQAIEVRARADEYAMHSLVSLETQLANTLHTVQNGIKALREAVPPAP
jgi:cell division septum initiation protein DivIVA